MDCSLPGVHGILQARILEWVAIRFSRGSFWLRGRTRVFCIAGVFFTIWATKDAWNFSKWTVENHSYIVTKRNLFSFLYILSLFLLVIFQCLLVPSGFNFKLLPTQTARSRSIPLTVHIASSHSSFCITSLQLNSKLSWKNKIHMVLRSIWYYNHQTL